MQPPFSDEETAVAVGGVPQRNEKFTDRKRYSDAFDPFCDYRDAGARINLTAEYADKRMDEYSEVSEEVNYPEFSESQKIKRQTPEKERDEKSCIGQYGRLQVHCAER